MRQSLERSWRGWVLGATLVFAGCKVAKTEYSNSPDSGAVPPAMRIDTSLTRTMPDSTVLPQDTAKKRPQDPKKRP